MFKILKIKSHLVFFSIHMQRQLYLFFAKGIVNCTAAGTGGIVNYIVVSRFRFVDTIYQVKMLLMRFL
ncbi:unnamed protein product [Lathyrus oleraceus]